MGLVEGAWQVCNERAASRTREAALMKRVSFHELAERELNDAALYYEQENAGLGFKFLEEVERYIGAIIKTPNAGQRVRGRVRRRILRTFPYAILYQTIAVTPIRDLHIADASALSLFDSEHSNARLILPIYLGNGTGTVGAVCSQLGQTYWGEIVNDILKMLRAHNPLNPYAWSESARLIGQQQ